MAKGNNSFNSSNNSPSNKGNKSYFNRGNNNPYNKANKSYNKGSDGFSDGQSNERNDNNQQNFRGQNNFSKRDSNEKFSKKPWQQGKKTFFGDENAVIDEVNTAAKINIKFDNDDDSDAEGEVVNKHAGNDSKFVKEKPETSSESDDEGEDETIIKNTESEESESEDETSSSEDDKSEAKHLSNNKTNEAETSESEADQPTSSNKMDEGETSDSEEDEEENTGKAELETNDIAGGIKEAYERKVLVLNVPSSIKYTHLQHFFSRYGEIERITETKKKNLFIIFKNYNDAVKSVEVNGMEYKGHHIFVVLNWKQAECLQCAVSVKCGLDIDSDALCHAFQSIGIIKYIRRFPNEGCAVVSFESIESAEIALKMGNITIGEQKLHISKVEKEDFDRLVKSQIPPQVPRQPRKFHQYHQRPTNYHQRPAGFNNYYERPMQHRNYHQGLGGPNNYNQGPAPPSQHYYGQQTQRTNYHQRPAGSNNYSEQPMQRRNYQQGLAGPNNYNQQPPQPPQLEDLIGPGLLVHKHKFNANTFTITFNGDKSQTQSAAEKKEQRGVKAGFVQKKNKPFRGQEGRGKGGRW